MKTNRIRLSARPITGLAAVTLLAGVTAVAGLADQAAAQDRVDQRRAGSSERVQPSRVGGPSAGQTRRPGATRGAGSQRADQSASQFRGGQNPIVGDLGAEFRRRNEVVTGTAPGGRSFRGVTGYASPFDFRGDLGSEDLDDFRARSIFSDPRLIQAAPALQYGSAVGLFEVYRSGRATSVGDIAAAGLQNQRLEDIEARQAGYDAQLSQLRRVVDASALAAGLDQFVRRSGSPTPVGMAETRDRSQRRRLDASALSGLQPVLTDADLLSNGVPMVSGLSGSGLLTSMDQARLLEDARAGRPMAGVGEMFRDSFVDARVSALDRGDRAIDGRIDGSAPTTRVGEVETADPADSIPAWQRIREEIARRYASTGRGDAVIEGMPTEDEMSDFERELDRLRRGLGANPGSTPTPNVPEPGVSTGPRGDDEEDDAEDADEEEVDVSRLGTSLRHGLRIDALVDPEDRTRAGEFIAQGEGELRSGDYFRAERTFTRALRLVPGHPTATVGLAHARLGAGLYIPAAMVVRDLFTYQPEMIGATYGDGIVPNRPRLLRALETLRERVADGRESSDTGLLIAYLGRLLDRPSVIREGLGVMRDEDSTDSLTTLLDAVWIAGVAGSGGGG